MFRNKLSEKEKQKIIADFVDNGNKSLTARLNKVSPTTVRKLVESNKELLNKFQQKKDESTQSILQYMETRKNKAMDFMDLAIGFMSDPEKLAKASVRDIAVAYGIIADKYVSADKRLGNDQSDGEIEKLIKGLKNE